MTLATLATASATDSVKTSQEPARQSTEPIPLIHITDLYHPPQDPDDQIDLATIMALDELDVRGIIIDVTRRFLEGTPSGFDIPRDPGLVLVTQLNYLLGRAVPVAVGPCQPLNNATDTAADRPRQEQTGINLILEILQSNTRPVVISVVGSVRVVTAAYNRAPELMRAKTRAVVLNAGSIGGYEKEWNVMLDPAAYVGLWQSGLPIHWYPCATERGAFVRTHERGTYWKTSHAELFRDLPEKLRAWFAYGFAGSSRGDFIRALDEQGRGAVWEHVLAGERNMWSTASLAMTAGRVLAQMPDGWRFVPHKDAEGLTTWPWRLDPVTVKVSQDGEVTWQFSEEAQSAYLFGRQPDEEFGMAMTEALNALLCTLSVVSEP